jgi:hypothetical protein
MTDFILIGDPSATRALAEIEPSGDAPPSPIPLPLATGERVLAGAGDGVRLMVCRILNVIQY